MQTADPNTVPTVVAVTAMLAALGWFMLEKAAVVENSHVLLVLAVTFVVVPAVIAASMLVGRPRRDDG
jgi:hypothetical protein